MTSAAADFDVGIIGGGPAGSSMACYLARAGVTCAVFERAIFPRPHVGESLVPSSTRVFRELDFLRVMEERKYVHKYGALWTSGPLARPYSMDWEGFDPGLEPDGSSRAAIEFAERPQPGVDQRHTYHVDRADFDLALLQHAERSGAKIVEGVRIERVDFRPLPGPHDIVFSLGGREHRVSARVVVDASGRRTMLGSQLGLKVADPVFDQYALHTWFEGFERGSVDQADFIHIHFLPRQNTWVWQIPIREGITSIGVVTQKKSFVQHKQDRLSFFWDCLRSRPDLAARLDRARMVRPLTEEADYSYAMRQFAGDGYVLLGDAARFVDPIFSTGVSIALNSARFASRDLLAALEVGDFARPRFASFEETMGRGVRHWYDFITVYYRLNVLFTYFVQNPKYRLDVLKLLQGDVYEEDEPAVLRLMRDKVREVEDNPQHMWHRVLGDLTANAFRPPAR